MKNKTLRIIVDITLIILGIIFLVFGIKDLINEINANKVEDSVRFKKDYSYVSTDNVYKYITLKELDKMLDSETGIVLVGNPKNPWTQVLVSPLNDVVKSSDMNIYYLDNSDIDESSKYYISILSKLEIEDFEVPNIIFIKQGTIIKLYSKSDLYESSYKDAPIEYWTENRLESFNKDMVEQIDNLNKK